MSRAAAGRIRPGGGSYPWPPGAPVPGCRLGPWMGPDFAVRREPLSLLLTGAVEAESSHLVKKLGGEEGGRKGDCVIRRSEGRGYPPPFEAIPPAGRAPRRRGSGCRGRGGRPGSNASCGTGAPRTGTGGRPPPGPAGWTPRPPPLLAKKISLEHQFWDQSGGAKL